MVIPGAGVARCTTGATRRPRVKLWSTTCPTLCPTSGPATVVPPTVVSVPYKWSCNGGAPYTVVSVPYFVPYKWSCNGAAPYCSKCDLLCALQVVLQRWCPLL